MGRQIGIGSLKYNYFTSTVQVHDFNMFDEHNEFTNSNVFHDNEFENELLDDDDDDELGFDGF